MRIETIVEVMRRKIRDSGSCLANESGSRLVAESEIDVLTLVAEAVRDVLETDEEITGEISPELLAHFQAASRTPA